MKVSADALIKELDSLGKKIRDVLPGFLPDYIDNDGNFSDAIIFILGLAESNLNFYDRLTDEEKRDLNLACRPFAWAKYSIENNDTGEAIRHIAEGNFSIGILYAKHYAIRKHTQKAAIAKNKETNDFKKFAIEHYKKNRADYDSKDDAAFKIAGKVVPSPFSTVRKWLRNV